MRLREPSEHARTVRGQPDANDAPVVVVGNAPHEVDILGTIHELDGAVVPEQQRLGDLADRRPAPVGISAYGEEELVLRGGDPDRLCLRLAPAQEVAEAGAEGQKALIVTVV